MVNWVLVIVGLFLVLLEVLLGAAAGFDFVLLGSAITLGGGLGLILSSTPVGLASGGLLALFYLAIGRRWVRHRLKGHAVRSNADALLGQHGFVVEGLGVNRAGRVRLGTEEWRAESSDPRADDIAPGLEVTVDRIEGVTVFVRRASDGGATR